MRKTVKKIGAAMLTAVMAMSAVPAGVYISDVSTAVTAYATEKPKQITAKNQYGDDCTYIRFENTEYYVYERSYYQDRNADFYYGAYKSELLKNNDDFECADFDIYHINGVKFNYSVKYSDNIYVLREDKFGWACFDPEMEKTTPCNPDEYCCEINFSGMHYMATAGDHAKAVMWFYENGERTYYVDQNGDMVNFYLNDELVSGKYAGLYSKRKVDKDNGLEYYTDENGQKVYVVYSNTQLKIAGKSSSGAQITLGKGFNLDTPITINSGEKINLNFGGDNINLGSTSSFFKVEEGGELILRNVTFANAKATDGSVIHNSGTAKLYNVSFDNCISSNNGGAIYNATGAELQLFADTASESVNITGCTASRNGGAIYNAGTLWVGESDDVGAITISGCHGVMGAGIYNSGELHVMQNVT
ncbi:MAG: hypothetical protein IKS03_05965, partial [Ruminococcus sp.]|nr:hypothetical protein [Ruminococcus sp.]